MSCLIYEVPVGTLVNESPHSNKRTTKAFILGACFLGELILPLDKFLIGSGGLENAYIHIHGMG